MSTKRLDRLAIGSTSNATPKRGGGSTPCAAPDPCRFTLPALRPAPVNPAGVALAAAAEEVTRLPGWSADHRGVTVKTLPDSRE